jgi:multicomponent Na+:H+ antiporter subunit F
MNLDSIQNFVLNFAVGAMILAMLIPLYKAGNHGNDIWEMMLAFSSVAAKSAIIILVISILRDDWMIGVAGVIILSVGNAGFMLLAHIIKGTGEL